ncbi:STAS domain-containing protein [Longispora sp. NPDC051575]|uniref:STAS domain-containing protein n=1 Tax=Longispora sp. NPDC051575 TaxID=3154943 RepID=UPI0034137ED3
MADESWDDNGLRFEAVDHDWCRVLRLDGVLDMAVLGSQESQLSALAVDAPGRAVIVDMSRVTFCDSTGLGVLVRTAKAVWAGSGTLRLAAPRPWVEKILIISGVQRALPIFPTVDDACGAALTEAR